MSYSYIEIAPADKDDLEHLAATLDDMGVSIDLAYTEEGFPWELAINTRDGELRMQVSTDILEDWKSGYAAMQDLNRELEQTFRE